MLEIQIKRPLSWLFTHLLKMLKGIVIVNNSQASVSTGIISKSGGSVSTNIINSAEAILINNIQDKKA